MISKTMWFGIICTVIGALYGGATDFSNKFEAAIVTIIVAAVVSIAAHLLLSPEQVKKKEREK